MKALAPLDYASPAQQTSLVRRYRGPILFAIALFSILAGLWIIPQPIEPLNLNERQDLAGRSRESMIRELGQPTFSRQMDLDSISLLPFRGGLIMKAYWPTDGDAKSVQIREMTWKQRRTYITTWLRQVDGKWQVINGMEWHHRMLTTAELDPANKSK